MKTILITGASSGIGAALAERYAGAEARLLLMGRNKDRLAGVKSLCEKKGAKVDISMIDVTHAEGMKTQVLKWDEAFPIDLVIANAGISGGTFGGTETAEQTRKVFDVNVNGVLNTVLPLVQPMIDRGSGQIAIMSSLAGFRGLLSAPAYSGSKNAVRAWGEALRLDLMKKGVQVNVICPGFIKTPLTDVNRFKMPMLMDVNKAAEIITSGLDKNKARIAFPFTMAAITRLISILPLWLSDYIVSRLPGK